MDLSIIIPVFNAGTYIENSLRALSESLPRFSPDYEVLFWDDASTDGGPETLKTGTSGDARMKCFFSQRNKGIGYTLRALLRQARGERIIYCDLDLPFGTAILVSLIEELDRHDIVVASRYRGGKNEILFRRKIASRCYYGLCRFLFDIPVRDIGSGTVAMRRGAVESLDLKSDGFDVHVEFFAKARRHGLSVKEIAGDCRDVGRGTFGVLRHGPRVVWQTLRFWREFQNDAARGPQTSPETR